MIAVKVGEQIVGIGSIPQANKILKSLGCDYTITQIPVDPVTINENVTIYRYVWIQQPEETENTYFIFVGQHVVDDYVTDEYVEKEFTEEQKIAIENERIEQRKAMAKAKRIKAMQSARVTFGGKIIKIDDATIVTLSSYISSETESVLWKCEGDEWLNLSLDDMKAIMREMAKIKKELFEKEYTEV